MNRSRRFPRRPPNPGAPGIVPDRDSDSDVPVGEHENAPPPVEVIPPTLAPTSTTSSVSEESSTVSGSLKYRLRHTWTINDFAATYLSADSTAHSPTATYPRINSGWFASSLDCSRHFRVRLAPRGRNERSKEYIGLYLEMKPAPKLVADITFSLLNERNEKVFSQDTRGVFTTPYNICGLSVFLQHNELQDPTNGVLPDDALTIVAEFDVSPPPSFTPPPTDPLVTIKAKAAQSALSSLGRLLDSGENSDVILVVKKTQLSAHKSLLSAGSPVFRSMLKSKAGQLKLTHLKVELARTLLRYIYTGTTEESDYTEELLLAADKYGITHLKALCCQYLCAQVNTENAARLLAFAHNHSVDQLKTATVEYIRAHWEEVILGQGWKPVQDLFTEEFRQVKLKEKDAKRRPPSMRALSSAEDSSTVNGSLKYRLKHEWTVDDFALTYLSASSGGALYPRLVSPLFSSPLDDQAQYRLIVRPKGLEKRPNILILNLELLSPPGASPLAQSLELNVKLSLLNGVKASLYTEEFRQVFACPKVNYLAAVEHRFLLDPASGLVTADELTILVEMAVFPEPILQLAPELLLAKLKVTSAEQVKGSLVGLLDSGEHSDVLLVVDGHEVPAHKALLSLHSPVFSAMFKAEMSEVTDGKVVIPDLKMDVAKKMLHFIYTGEVENLPEYAEELLVAADKYDLTLLKSLCGEYLCGQVNLTTGARLLALADRHSVDQLKTVTFDYINANLHDFLLTDDFLLVQRLFTQILRQKRGEKRPTPEE